MASTRAIGCATTTGDDARRSPISRASAPISAGGRRGFQIVYGYRFERNHTVDPRHRQRSVAVRHRRQPREAERGVRCSTAATIRSTRARARSARSRSINAAPFLGSDVSNRKLLMQQFLFVPLGRLVLASRAQVGLRVRPRSAAVYGSLPRRRRDQRARLRRRKPRSARLRMACRSAAIAC